MAVEDPDYNRIAEVQGDSDSPVTADKLADDAEATTKAVAEKREENAEKAAEDEKTEDEKPATPVQPVRRPQRNG